MKKKCVFVGEAGTGKTAILHRIMENNFLDNPESTSIPSNHSISYSYKGTPVKLELWDTIGQERFRSVNKLFYKGADICFLIYSIDIPESFTELKNYWVPTIQSLLGNNTALCVVGNKIDLFDKQNIIEESEGKLFADSINSTFILVSAKLGFGFPDILNAGLESYCNYHNLSEPPEPSKDNGSGENEFHKNESTSSVKLDEKDFHQIREKVVCCL